MKGTEVLQNHFSQLYCVYLKKQMKTPSLFKLQLNCIYYSKTTATWCIM